VADNYKAIKKPEDNKKINDKAQTEFTEFVKTLRSHGVNVLVFDRSKKLDLVHDFSPFSCFVKSWMTMGPSGNIIIYPTAIKSREIDKNSFRYILEDIMYSFEVKRVYNLFMGPEKFLEGGGSLVIDRIL
jgi:hypothetical protein